jgi:hypothetical protein
MSDLPELIPFVEARKRLSLGVDNRKLRQACARHGIPVVKFSNKNLSLKASDFQLLLDRASTLEPA